MMGWSPRCYVTSFVEIGRLVQANGFDPMIYGRRGHFMSCDPDAGNKLLFPYPRRLQIKFGFDWPIGFGGEAL